ncbi:MAG: class I SAM-dependent methyltransferase [Acidimicrobiia bacterium]|nr:class I SAM-dependent methyltransferase [Acidimicrobiia bacterium]
MGWYTDRLLPRVIDRVLDNPDFREVRRRQLAPLKGRVLEVGFGAGPNVPHLPDGVEVLYAIDPAISVRPKADERIRRRGVEVKYLGLDGARIDLDDESIDHVVSTMTLCTIPDVETALDEIHRVLRPGGQFHFVDHGRAPDPRVASWQDRLQPIHSRLFGGCHLDRDIPALVEGCGLHISHVEADYMKGPKVMGYLHQGIAVKAVGAAT